ncbi:hypothetical protein [Aliiroseovarius sp.]|uniref:hypothetical protein n=1 Tax=Aliiroseovarius sp. TaxID=1872442 RepID=UPI003BA95522
MRSFGVIERHPVLDDNGSDTYTGGTGADSFVFKNGADVVTDFDDSEGDLIQVDNAIWGGGTKTAAELLTYASVVGSDIVFDFGSGHTLTLQGYTDLVALENNIESVNVADLI